MRNIKKFPLSLRCPAVPRLADFSQHIDLHLITSSFFYSFIFQIQVSKAIFVLLENEFNKLKTRPGVKPKLWLYYSLKIDYQEQSWTVRPCSYIRGRPAFGHSCTEFVYPGCKFYDVLTEHIGLLHVHPLSVHLKF